MGGADGHHGRRVRGIDHRVGMAIATGIARRGDDDDPFGLGAMEGIVEDAGVDKRSLMGGHAGDDRNIDHAGAGINGEMDRFGEIGERAGRVRAIGAIVGAGLADAEEARAGSDVADDPGDDGAVPIAIEKRVRSGTSHEIRDRFDLPELRMSGNARVDDGHGHTLAAGNAMSGRPRRRIGIGRRQGNGAGRGRCLSNAESRGGKRKQNNNEHEPHPSPLMSKNKPATWAAKGRDAAMASDSARSHHTTVVGSRSGTLAAHMGALMAADTTPSATTIWKG